MRKLNKIHWVTLSLLAVACVLSVSASAREPMSLEARKVTEGRGRSIIVTPNYDLQVGIWTESPSCFIGDNINIFFNVNKDCFIYVFNIDTDGVTRMIFPNYYDNDNFVRAGSYSIPGGNYHFEVTGPAGREYLRAIAVRERYGFMREFERFAPHEPFPLLPGGVDGFRLKIETQEKQPQPIQPREGRPPSKPGKLSIVPGPVIPRPQIREYAESYTSFYVRPRWLGDDEHYYIDPARTQKIKFRSVPDNADLYIDGQYYGKSSKNIKLSYGPHKVRMRKKGYYDWVRSVYVDENSPDTITAYLQSSRSSLWMEYRKEWDLEFRDWRYNERGREGERVLPGAPQNQLELKIQVPLKGQKTLAPAKPVERPSLKPSPFSKQAEENDEEVIEEKR